MLKIYRLDELEIDLLQYRHVKYKQFIQNTGEKPVYDMKNTISQYLYF